MTPRPPRSSHSRIRRRVLPLLAAAGLLAVPLAAPASAAAAQTGPWEIRSFDAVIVVNQDGSLRVTETIEVTFHHQRRGIFREIPFQVPVDDDTVRRYRFDQVKVSTSNRAPDKLKRERNGDFVVWRVGDPEKWITGDYTYTLSYRVRGALNSFDDHDELWWNVTGDRWDVEIPQATATVRAPAISEVTCYAGPTGSTDPCAAADLDEQTATFAADPLPRGTQLDVVVSMPPGVVAVPSPELEPADLLGRFVEVQLPRVFQVDRARTGMAGLVGLAGLAIVLALARRGRDERATPTVGALPGGVEYRPPDGLRPAQLRTLLTERVDDVSLSATLVDLAVRGHVRIEELPKSFLGRRDWMIHRLPSPPDDPLQPYEQEVLTGLFARQLAAVQLRRFLGRPPGMAGGPAMAEVAATPAVTVSGLRDGSFHKHYRRVVELLYGDVVRRGFFRRNPSHVRTAFTMLSLLVVLAGLAGIVGLFLLERWHGVYSIGLVTYGLVLTPLPVVGLLMLLVSQWAPRRTPAGTTMNQRAQGFREFVRTAEADRMEFAEREQIFVSYLPYAMAFDCVDRWVKAFERIGVPAAAAAGAWYVGHGVMDFGSVTSSLSSLGSQVGGSMSKTASSGGSSGSSGGGGAGGGGGGGGGGSW